MAKTFVEEPVDRPARPTPDRPGGRPRGQWRPLLVRMHFYAGVLVAPFIFLACLTGGLYAFNPQLDRLLEPGLLVVANPGSTTLPLDRQVAAAVAAVPGLNVVSVQPSSSPDETTRVNFFRPGGPPMTYRTAFVNPSTGQVQGSKDISSMGGAMPFSTWLAQFHGDLGLGEVGRWYSELASLWIVVLTLGGIVVWWQRCAVHRSARSGRFWRRFAVVERGRRPGLRRTTSWHSVIGVWTAVLALLFGLTGLPFARTSGPKWVGLTGNMHRSSVTLDTTLPGHGGPAGTTGTAGTGGTTGTDGTDGMAGMPGMSGMTGTGTHAGGSAPAPGGGTGTSGTGTSGTGMTGGHGPGTGGTNATAGTGTGGHRPAAGAGTGTGTGGHGPGTGGGGHGMTMSTGVSPAVVAAVDLDAMVAAARRAGVDQDVRISAPTRPGTGWTVAENKQNWPVAYDSALLDPATNTVVRTLDWERATPTVDKVNRYIMLFHFGRLFGLAGEVIFGLAMLAVLAIIWWGYRMWWQRRPRGTAWRPGPAPARGSWRRAPRVSLTVWGVITLATFWVFPVLGVSVLGFLALDAVLGRVTAGRRERAALS